MEHEVYWSPDSVFSLLDKVKRHEELWSPRHPQYHRKNIKRSLFDQICRELREEYPQMNLLITDQVVTKFQYLRSHYQKQLRKIQNESSGSERKYSPKWEYFQACSFFNPVYSNNNDELSFDSADKEAISPAEAEMVSEGLLEDVVDSPLKIEESLVLDQPCRIPVLPVSKSTSTNSCDPKTSKTQRSCISDALFQNKVIESMDSVTKSRKHEAKQPFRFDAATEAVMACMNYIPASKQRLKAELTQKVFVLVSEIIQKCNAEGNAPENGKPEEGILPDEGEKSCDLGIPLVSATDIKQENNNWEFLDTKEDLDEGQTGSAREERMVEKRSAEAAWGTPNAKK